MIFFSRILPTALAFVLAFNSDAATLDLVGTVYEEAGKKYNIDPDLLYSISIVESAVLAEGTKKYVQPHPYALRTNKPFYPKDRKEAEEQLKKLYTKSNKYSVDVGLCQINTLWQGHRVKKISDLLDPKINTEVAAEILSECIDRYPNSAVEAIGAYHSSNKTRANRYARYVLRIYTNIKRAKHENESDR